MARVFGYASVLAVNTGTYAVPVWTVIENVGDLDFTIESDEADESNRAGGGWEHVCPGLHKATVDFDMLHDAADTDYTLVRDAQIARTLKEFAIADGTIATTGTTYLRLHAYVFKGGQSQKLRERNRAAFTLKPGYSSNANPAYVTV